jgi:hypothetical protein
MKKLMNVYCDETCHLEGRGDKVMVLGAVYCDASDVKAAADQIRLIKKKHGLARHFETKWTKVSPSKTEYYLDLIDYFFESNALRFRAVLVPDKDILDHEKFEQTHNNWYYKMYFVMLKWLISSANRYHIYIDIKDTKGAARVRDLHDVLANNIYDFHHECVEKVQQVRSHEVELMQLADLLIGAIGYASRYPTNTDSAKAHLVQHISTKLPTGYNSLAVSTAFTYTRFNILKWDARIS